MQEADGHGDGHVARDDQGAGDGRGEQLASSPAGAVDDDPDAGESAGEWDEQPDRADDDEGAVVDTAVPGGRDDLGECRGDHQGEQERGFERGKDLARGAEAACNPDLQDELIPRNGSTDPARAPGGSVTEHGRNRPLGVWENPLSQRGLQMGFARRVVRKSVRKATPRPVRQAIHPARTVKNAVTPRPVKQVSRAAYAVRHPVGAAENKFIGAVLDGGSRRRRSGLFRTWLDARRRGRATPDTQATATPSQPSVPDRTVAPPRRPQTSRSGVPVNEAARGESSAAWSRSGVQRLLKLGAQAEARGQDLVLVRDGRQLARQRFSSAETAAAAAARVNEAAASWRAEESGKDAAGPSLAGELELEVRRHIGLGGDWQSPR